MSYLHDYFGLFGCLLILIVAPLIFLRQPRVSRKTVTIVICLMMGLAVLPINNLTLLAYIRAGLGDLSITSMAMLCLMIAAAYSGQSFIQENAREKLHNSVLVSAVILYPLGLGLTPFDSYALGYGSVTLFIALLGFTAYLILRQYFIVLAILLLGVAAYLLNLLPSDNIWDYLLDPWIVILAFSRKARRLASIRYFQKN